MFRWWCIHLPDAPAVGPVPSHARRQQQRGDGFVKKEMVINQLLLLLFRHVLQSVVPPLQIPIKDVQTCRGQRSHSQIVVGQELRQEVIVS